MERKDFADMSIDEIVEAIINGDFEIPEDPNLDHIEMNNYQDVAVYKDGTRRVIYTYWD